MTPPCERCDHPKATAADWEWYRQHECPGANCTERADVCFGGQTCADRAVDRRDEALALRARIGEVERERDEARANEVQAADHAASVANAARCKTDRAAETIARLEAERDAAQDDERAIGIAVTELLHEAGITLDEHSPDGIRDGLDKLRGRVAEITDWLDGVVKGSKCAVCAPRNSLEYMERIRKHMAEECEAHPLAQAIRERDSALSRLAAVERRVADLEGHVHTVAGEMTADMAAQLDAAESRLAAIAAVVEREEARARAAASGPDSRWGVYFDGETLRKMVKGESNE